jgi:8-oxoguanine deaminase
MVQGQWRVRDGSIMDLDIEALISRHQQSAKRLVNKVESV